MKIYRIAQAREYSKGAIFGYTLPNSMRSHGVWVSEKAAKTWNTHHGITHEEAFGLQQTDETANAWTWIYDIANESMTGYTEMNPEIHKMALDYAKMMAREAERRGLTVSSFLKIYRIAQIVDLDSALDSVHDAYCSILKEYWDLRKGKRKNASSRHMSWSVIPIARVKKIWQDYAKNGVVRDTGGMQQIKDKMLEILARLQASNDLSGHGINITDEYISDICGLKIPEGDNIDFYFNFLETDYGTPVSDYGLDKLWAIAKVLMKEGSAEKQLLLCDQMLNIIHQRGDLSALFIEGGSSSLNDLKYGHLKENPPDPEAVKDWENRRR